MRPSDMRAVPVGVPIADLAPQAAGALVCRVNGEWLLRESWASLTRPEDIIEWYDLPQDKEDFRGLLQIAAIFASFIPGLQPFAMYIYAANAAYNLLVPPSNGQLRQQAAQQTGDNFTTGLNGNQARLDQPIPKVCGRREINPPFACKPYFEYRQKLGETDPDLDNEQYFFAVYAVGVGDHDVIAKVANTPITRFADVVTAQYLAPGVQPSTVLANVTTADEVSGQVLESGRPVGGFAACAPNRTCSAIGYDIVATRGLGKTGALSVQWQAYYRPINDFGQVLGSWAPLGSVQTRTAFTATPQRWSVRETLTTPARVEIRIARLDVQDTDPAALHEIAWAGLRAYLAEPAPLNAETAHYEVVLRATNQLSQNASRDFRLIAEAKCRTLNSSLVWQAETHTRNPAWWLLDLATSDTWGIDKPDATVDLQSFYDLAVICDARQDRFDYVFDSTVNAWDAMQLIARTCRSRVFRRNGVISVARDELADLPVTAFTPRNCNPGMSISEKHRKRNAPDGFIVEYEDHRTSEWTDIECPCPGVVSMSNPIRLRLPGIIGATHAEREGLYEAANLIYRPRTASCRTEMHGVLPAYMSPCDFLPDIRGYGHSGDVAFWDEATLVMGLTEPPDFSGGTLYLTLMRDDGTLTSAVAVTPGPTAYDVVLPAAPDFELVLDDGTRERPKYLIGAKETAKVLAITDGGKTDDGAQLFDLAFVLDDERVHTADVHLLPGPGDIQDPVGDPDDSDDESGGLIVIIDLRAHTVSDQQIGNDLLVSTASFTIHNNGTATSAGNQATLPAISNEWIRFAPVELAVAALYEVRATLLSETDARPLTAGTLDTWQSCDTTRTWTLQSQNFGDPYEFNAAQKVLRIEIREASTTIVQASANITLSTSSSVGA
jgi:hypothetical protein